MLEKLVKNPLFDQIVDYFLLHKEERIILRQLKAVFESEENLELFLEQMVANQLIERKERQYQLIFPIFSVEDYPELPSVITQAVSSLGLSKRKLFIGEYLWDDWFSKVEKQTYFFGIKSEEEQNTSLFFERLVAGNEQLEFISIQYENTTPFNLASYFYSLRMNQTPNIYQPLQKLIGDVDINYFVQQTKKFLNPTGQKKKIPTRKNIFFDTLVTGKVINIGNQEIELIKPVYDKSDEKTFQLILNTINQELTDKQLLGKELNNQIAVKQYLITNLIKNVLGEETQFFDYLKM